MVNINATDFLDLLSNADVKAKFAEIFNVSINNAIDSKINKLNENVTKKLDEHNATISALSTELAVKDAIIARIQQENQQLKGLMANLSARNEDILQESKRNNLIISGFTSAFAEATANGNDASAPPHKIVNKVVEFCHNALNFPDVSAQDILRAYFLPLAKPVPMESSCSYAGSSIHASRCS